MKIKIYGTRGSIPSPSIRGFSTKRYGGNTTSLLVNSKKEKRFIIDCGTGLRTLGLELFEHKIGTPQNPMKADIFLTHTHSDHTQGIPFFKQFYIGANSFNLYSMYSGNRLEEILATQQDPENSRNFPIRYEDMPSRRKHFKVFELPKDKSLEISFTETHHPQKCLAYKFVENGKTFVFGGDHEFGLDAEADQRLLDLTREADVAIMDSQYTPEEYESRKNWGHSSYDRVVEFAIRASIKRLYLTHHDPEHDDEFLGQMLGKARLHATRKKGKLRIYLAREGLEIKL